VLPRKKFHTAVQQKQQLAWWGERIGHLRLSEVTSGVIVEHRDALVREIAGSSVNRYLTVMSHLLTVCVREWGWLPDSPMRNVSRLREPRGRVRYLDASERERLLQACRANEHRYLYPVVMLALCTGCRRREITGLRWPQVGQKCEAITLIETKNGETRRVPIVEPALTILREHARTGRVVGVEWVFPGRTLRGPCDISKAWTAAVEAAELQDFRFHDLRHTTASYLAMSGATPLEIAEILGHRKLDMVRRYAHLSQSSVSGTLSRAMTQFLT
jgi:integrase